MTEDRHGLIGSIVNRNEQPPERRRQAQRSIVVACDTQAVCDLRLIAQGDRHAAEGIHREHALERRAPLADLRELRVRKGVVERPPWHVE